MDYKKLVNEIYSYSENNSENPNRINEVFEELSKISENENVYFHGSSLQVFEHALQLHLDKKKEEYLGFNQTETLINTHKHFTSNLLIGDRLKTNLSKTETLSNDFKFVIALNDENFELFRNSMNEKIQFLDSKLNNLGIDIIEGEKGLPQYKVNEQRKKERKQALRKEAIEVKLINDGYIKRQTWRDQWVIQDSSIYSELLRGTSDKFPSLTSILESFRNFELEVIQSIRADNFDSEKMINYDRVYFFPVIDFNQLELVFINLYNIYLKSFPQGNITSFLNREYSPLLLLLSELCAESRQFEFRDSYGNYDFYYYTDRFSWVGSYIAIEKKPSLDISENLHFYITFFKFLFSYLKEYTQGEKKDLKQWPKQKDDNYEKHEIKLSWKGNQTELTELTKALIESNLLIGKQKEIFAMIQIVFNKKINNPDKLIQDIKNRNINSETLLIDKLKRNLIQYIEKEKET